MFDKSDPKFVVIGGGTGISTLLRGLKRFSDAIHAIVTMADDGGGSGMLRRDYGMLPPGDVRNCLVALANTEPSLEKLLQYRFKEGRLEGQNMGNLIIAALTDIYGGFAEGVGEAAEVLKITGRVLPVTTESIRLVGRFSDGSTLKGESRIPIYAEEHGLSIESIELEPNRPEVNKDCVEAILTADMVIIGPGSLYTSLVPNLLVPGISEAIEKAQAPLVYVANIMQQRGETVGMDLADHLRTLEAHSLRRVVDYVLVNDDAISEEILSRYLKEEGAHPIYLSAREARKISRRGTLIERGPFATVEGGYVRHDGLMVAQRLLSVCDRYHEIHCQGVKSEL